MDIRYSSIFSSRSLLRFTVKALFLCLPLLLVFQASKSFAEPLRVALLLESDSSAMSQQLKKGLSKAAAEYGAEAKVIVTPPDVDKQTEAFRKAAKENELVIVAEARLHEVLRNNAASFRRVKFGCIDTGVRAANIMSVTYKDEDPCFLAGAASAMIAGKNGSLGWIMDDKSPIQDHMLSAFTKGAELSAQNTQVLVRETGFDNPMKVGEALSELASKGASCVVLAAGVGSRGGYAVACKMKTLLISLDSPQTELAPGNVALAVVKRHDLAIEEIVKSAASSSFRAKEIIVYDLQNKGVELFVSPNLKNSFPNAMGRRIRELRHELAVGNIELEDLRNPTYCNCH